jgi:hypothetical protein
MLAKSVETVIPDAQVTYLFRLLVSKNATLDMLMLARSFTKNHCYDLDNAHAQLDWANGDPTKLLRLPIDDPSIKFDEQGLLPVVVPNVSWT